jgi:hypothetical protein
MSSFQPVESPGIEGLDSCEGCNALLRIVRGHAQVYEGMKRRAETDSDTIG